MPPYKTWPMTLTSLTSWSVILAVPLLRKKSAKRRRRIRELPLPLQSTSRHYPHSTKHGNILTTFHPHNRTVSHFTSQILDHIINRLLTRRTHINPQTTRLDLKAIMKAKHYPHVCTKCGDWSHSRVTFYFRPFCHLFLFYGYQTYQYGSLKICKAYKQREI